MNPCPLLVALLALVGTVDRVEEDAAGALVAAVEVEALADADGAPLVVFFPTPSHVREGDRGPLWSLVQPTPQPGG